MAFTRNVNKPLSLSFGSYPISVERRGRMLDADWIWAGADGVGTGRGDRTALGATIRRNISSKAERPLITCWRHMLRTLLWTSRTKAIVAGNRVVFYWKEGLSSSKKKYLTLQFSTGNTPIIWFVAPLQNSNEIFIPKSSSDGGNLNRFG